VISDENRAEFEELGPNELQKRVDLYRAEKRKQAEEWLDEKAHGADRALAREQLSIAASAKDAAWTAAQAAERAAAAAERAATAAERTATKAEMANRIAIAALVIAIISAVAANVVPHFWTP
jgi:hypothetical protein